MSKAIIRHRFNDGLITFDRRTIDSAGAFLIGELERLDQKLHQPLASVTWSRDIQLRTDVSIADEFSSFTNSTFAAAGGVAQSGKAWIGKDASALTGIALGIDKTTTPLNLWGMQLGWTLPELESAQKLGRPVDQQKFAGMQLKYNMDVDEMVYVGDASLGLTGLVNAAAVSNSTAAVTGKWAGSTPSLILADIDELLNSVWEKSAYAVCPDKLLLPPQQFSFLASQLISQAGNISILEFIKTNSICNSINGRPLDIQPLKWLRDAGQGGSTRMVAYTNDEEKVRFPLVPLQRTPLEYRDLRQLTSYFGRVGAVEVVYKETLGYRDGI